MAKKKTISENPQNLIAPVITVLGHVDHGKTTLLDTIRKTSIAEREHGGITQKIGASNIEIEHEGKKRKITFIDTPGHEAFSLMRGRGVMAADIALLVVSSVDGVMPQTKEAITLIKSANTPYIVVLAKSDVAEKNLEKVKGQLLKEEVLLEGMGGEVPFIEVSAKTNHNIKELLGLILLVWEMQSKPASTTEFKGVIIESKMDQKAGPKATVVIKSGKVSIKDELFTDGIKVRVRSLTGSSGESLKEAGVGDAVEMLGFEKVPPVGSVVRTTASEVKIAETGPTSLLEAPEEDPRFKVIVCADTQGSLEAIINAISKKDVKIVLKKTGEVEGSDVLFAKSTGAVILGFNTKVTPTVTKLAETEKILIRNYNIIYELLDELEDFLEGKRIAGLEKILGKAKILASFPFEKQKILGISVLEGRIAKGDKIRIMHDDNAVGESTIASLRQGKEQVSKVEKGSEAGILSSSNLDFTIGDMVISHG